MMLSDSSPKHSKLLQDDPYQLYKKDLALKLPRGQNHKRGSLSQSFTSQESCTSVASKGLKFFRVKEGSTGHATEKRGQHQSPIIFTKSQIKFTSQLMRPKETKGAVESPQPQKPIKRILLRSRQGSQIDEFLKSFEQTEKLRDKIKQQETASACVSQTSERKSMRRRFNLFASGSKMDQSSERDDLSQSSRKPTIDIRQQLAKKITYSSELDKLLLSSSSLTAINPDEWLALLKGEKLLSLISPERLRYSIIRGIPTKLRGPIWCIISNVAEEKSKHGKKVYRNLIEIQDSEEEYKISKDLKRTIPEQRLFQEDYKLGKNRLYNVLKAYASFDNEIGYAQGVNYLAAILLIHIQSEEDAFWCLVYLLHKKNWRMVYDNNNPIILYSFKAAFSPMFLTISIYHMPLDLAARIFEVFLIEGETFLIRFLMKMIELKQSKILTLTEHELLEYLRQGIVIECIGEQTFESLLDY